MKNILDNLVEISGINEVFPTNWKLFKELQVQQTLEIRNEKINMARILKADYSMKVTNSKIISSPRGISREGKKLTGKKLLIAADLISNYEYLSENKNSAMQSISFRTPLKAQIILPNDIPLISDFTVVPYIQDVYLRLLTKRKVFESVLMVFVAKNAN